VTATGNSPLAIVAAVAEEVKPFLRSGRFRLSERRGSMRLYRSRKDPNVAVLLGGIGKACAEAAAAYAIDELRPAAIVSAGFAGGVKDGLRVGDVFTSANAWVADGDQEHWTEGKHAPVSVATLAIAGIRNGDCLTVPQVVKEPAAKRRAGVIFPVAVAEMEAYWVAKAAAGAGIPCAVLKVVLDPLDAPLPPVVSRLAAARTITARAAALGSIAAAPAQAQALARLTRQASAAGSRLSEALAELSSAGVSAFSASRASVKL